MRDIFKRLAIAGTFMVFIGVLIIGAKVIEAEENNKWMWPIDDGIITDTFGSRDGHHHGMDIADPKGTAVKAVKTGTINRSYYSNSYGNVVFILHNNEYETVYAHLSERLVEKGEYVKQGEVIGKVGDTGHSTGNHLHFEIHFGMWNMKKTNAVNPMLVLEDIEDPGAIKAFSKHVGNDYEKNDSEQ